MLKCFVIMPFAPAFDRIFETVQAASGSAGLGADVECYWLKDVQAAGRITDDILRGLVEAAFCIADVTGHNPNVMWETGYAMALGKPTILIGQDIDELPFDLKSHRVLAYDQADLGRLREKLVEGIRQTLALYELKGSDVPASSAVSSVGGHVIAVTGCMAADELLARRRVEQTLTPFLAETSRWLVGSVGVVDKAAVAFLIEHEQRVSIVGYHRFDCAPELRALVNSGAADFIDASLEKIPKGMAGADKRDALFCARADLVILLWDGESPGTRAMVDYFRGQESATLLAFL